MDDSKKEEIQHNETLFKFAIVCLAALAAGVLALAFLSYGNHVQTQSPTSLNNMLYSGLASINLTSCGKSDLVSGDGKDRGLISTLCSSRGNNILVLCHYEAVNSTYDLQCLGSATTGFTANSSSSKASTTPKN